MDASLHLWLMCVLLAVALVATLLLAMPGGRWLRESFEDTTDSSLSLKIIKVFMKQLNRHPTDEELDENLRRSGSEAAWDEDALAKRLQQTSEYYHASKLQTNTVGGDMASELTDREIGMLVQRKYREVFGTDPSYETEAFLKERYREMGMDDERFAKYVEGLSMLLEGQGLQQSGDDAATATAGTEEEQTDADADAEADSHPQGSSEASPFLALDTVYTNATDDGSMLPGYAWAVPMPRTPSCVSSRSIREAARREQWRLQGTPLEEANRASFHWAVQRPARNSA